jgi:hypothetical protein
MKRSRETVFEGFTTGNGKRIKTNVQDIIYESKIK